jgi:AcrR family transcriptional regulator
MDAGRRKADMSNRIAVLARQAFAEKGFDGTSMQDVAQAAGMSVGNLYRYFPSKMSIIETLIGGYLDGIESELNAVALSPDPLASLNRALRRRLVERHAGDRMLSAEIAAAVARTPELAVGVAKKSEALTVQLARILESARNLPEALALTRAHAVSLVMHGAITAPPALGWDDQSVTDLAMWILDRVIQDNADEA